MKNDETNPHILGEPITGSQVLVIAICLISIVGLFIVFMGQHRNDVPFTAQSRTIKVSESCEIATGISIKYTGMVSDSIFSIVFSSWGYPLYYPVSTTTFEIKGKGMRTTIYEMEIVKVTPEYLRYKVLGRDL